jgi:hypothetical protein
MDFQTIDHHTPGCIQATLYGTQANIRVTRPPKYLAKITKNGHFSMYLGSGRSGSKWIMGSLTIIHSDASSALTKALRRIFAPLPRRPDPNTLLKSRKMAILGCIRGWVAQEVNGFWDY